MPRKATSVPDVSDEPFRAAVEAAECLKWQPGLQVVSAAEGKGQVAGKDPSQLLGGAFIDEDCKAAPVGSGKHRWDYVLGYQRSDEAIAHFVEVHPAHSHGVTEVEAKLAWLRDYLEQKAQAELNALKREYHWVASGKIDIPKHVPQYKMLQTRLRKLGLNGPVKHLTLA